METKLYEDLKFCWKAGYKLKQIKEYCNTHLSIEELQTEFKIMWANELQAWKRINVLEELGVEDQCNGFYEHPIARRIAVIPDFLEDTDNFITRVAARNKRGLLGGTGERITDENTVHMILTKQRDKLDREDSEWVWSDNLQSRLTGDEIKSVASKVASVGEDHIKQSQQSTPTEDDRNTRFTL